RFSRDWSSDVCSSDLGWPVQAQRVMFSSRTQDDVAVPVTGTFIDATQPWRGAGERPTIVIAPGTVGQGDQCALSLAFSTGMHVRSEERRVGKGWRPGR